MKKKKKVKVRRLWAVPPATKVIPDKRLRLYRKRKHRGRGDF